MLDNSFLYEFVLFLGRVAHCPLRLGFLVSTMKLPRNNDNNIKGKREGSQLLRGPCLPSIP